MQDLVAVKQSDGSFAVPEPADKRTRRDYLDIALRSSVSMPVFAIADREAVDAKRRRIEEARAASPLLSPETLDS